jgi:hypothetical protein
MDRRHWDRFCGEFAAESSFYRSAPVLKIQLAGTHPGQVH